MMDPVWMWSSCELQHQLLLNEAEAEADGKPSGQ